MTVAVIAEKNSAAQHMALALGGSESAMKGTFEGTDYVVVTLAGHLYEFVEPEAMVPESLREKYHSWDVNSLPWDPKDMNWKRKTRGSNASSIIKRITPVLSSADELVIATDLDPTGEGDLLAWEVIDELKLGHKPVSRMHFVDEYPEPLRKAFREREKLSGMEGHGAFRKAQFRTQADFLSLQSTREATALAAQGAVLRQGRLKSPIVTLVGARWEAINNYVRKPFFQERFRDENNVVYTDPEETSYDTAAEVVRNRKASSVVVDSKEIKHTAPRRLLDLAALSGRLASRGYAAGEVLKTYQKMYEAQVLSYPRTEDKTITHEQFKELAPLADKIAAVVGVDTSLLTHREPRKTHVKDKGAHGANRPGPVVPASLDALRSTYGTLGAVIYEELARSYLAMLAEDYEYEQQKGHVADYPTFLGSVLIPKKQGWKAVFVLDDEEEGNEEEAGVGLGSTAEPFVHEGANTKPSPPTQTWLVNQLGRFDVGTGATRTSTIAEVTNAKSKFPLLKISKTGQLSMTQYGEMSYHMLRDTLIGDIAFTEQVYKVMSEIEAGEASREDALKMVTDMVVADMKIMRANGERMRKELGLSEVAQQKEKFQGTWKRTGSVVKFSREWSGVRFTDEQCQELLEGQEIEFEAISRAGKPYQARGTLEEQTFNGHKFVGFKPDFGPRKDEKGRPVPPDSWCQHTFTAEEKEKLSNGESIYADDFVSKKEAGKKNPKTFDCSLSFQEENGQMKLVPAFKKKGD